MIRSLVRLAIGGTLLVGVMGSGACPGCYNDECSPKGKTYCRDNIAYICDEYAPNSAYGLFETNCSETNSVCVVVDETDAGTGPEAICVSDCGDASTCPDAAPCSGDSCVADGAVDAGLDAAPDAGTD